MRIMVLIEKVETGERRWYDEGDDYSAIEFQWSEGNYSCDCNRALFFARAGGEPEHDVDCGEELYAVHAILREDGFQYPVDH